MMNEGVIKKGGDGSEIIEEIMFIMREMEKKKDIFEIEEDLMKEANDFVKIGKEKGFEEKLWKNKNVIISSFIFFEWRELCKEEVWFIIIIVIIYLFI